MVFLEQGWTDLGPSKWLGLIFIEVLLRPGDVLLQKPPLY